MEVLQVHWVKGHVLGTSSLMSMKNVVDCREIKCYKSVQFGTAVGTMAANGRGTFTHL